MNRKHCLGLAAAVLIGAGLSGCSTISKINPLGKSDKENKVTASEGERIPLIAFNQKLEVSDALKGQSFFVAR